MMGVYKILADTDTANQKFLFKLPDGDKGNAFQTHRSQEFISAQCNCPLSFMMQCLGQTATSLSPLSRAYSWLVELLRGEFSKFFIFRPGPGLRHAGYQSFFPWRLNSPQKILCMKEGSAPEQHF